MKIIKSSLISWLASIFATSFFLLHQNYSPEKIHFDDNPIIALLFASLLISLPALFATIGHLLFFQKNIILRLIGAAFTGLIICLYSFLIYNVLPEADIINFAIPYYVSFIVLFLIINTLTIIIKKILD